MKRIIALLFGVFLLFGTASAAPTNLIVKGFKSIKTQTGGVKRAPANLPIEVFYDDETREVQVIADESLGNGEVILSDQNKIEVGYSKVLNCTLTLPPLAYGTIHVYMFGENWDADAWIAPDGE